MSLSPQWSSLPSSALCMRLQITGRGQEEKTGRQTRSWGGGAFEVKPKKRLNKQKTYQCSGWTDSREMDNSLQGAIWLCGMFVIKCKRHTCFLWGKKGLQQCERELLKVLDHCVQYLLGVSVWDLINADWVINTLFIAAQKLCWAYK